MFGQVGEITLGFDRGGSKIVMEYFYCFHEDFIFWAWRQATDWSCRFRCASFAESRDSKSKIINSVYSHWSTKH